MPEFGSEFLDNYFIAKAPQAVKDAMVATRTTLVEDEPTFMDRYDMMTQHPAPTWKDVVTIPYGLAVIGATCLRYWLTEKLFKTDSSASIVDRTLFGNYSWYKENPSQSSGSQIIDKE